MELNIKKAPANHEQGNILVTSLLILMVMNLLGIGLANVATKEWSSATYKTIDSELFQTTEGCAQDVIIWFGTQTVTPSSIADFTGTPVNSGSSTIDIANKLANYSYNCSVTYITSKQTTSSSSSGVEVGNSDGSYGSGGNKVIKDYYTIVSTGSGPKNSSKTINTVISVEY
jgi:Tfp pilus assembly protein PilX